MLSPVRQQCLYVAVAVLLLHFISLLEDMCATQ